MENCASSNAPTSAAAVPPDNPHGRAIDRHAARRHFRLGEAGLCAENIDEPVHVTGDIIARRIELEVHQALGLRSLTLLHGGADVGSDAVRQFQLVKNAADAVADGRISRQHVIERALGGVVFAFDTLAIFLDLVRIRSGVDFIGSNAERFDGHLGLGQRQPRRRQVPGHDRVKLIDFLQPLQTELVGCNRQKPKRADEQYSLQRNRQMNEFQYGHVRKGGILRGCF